MPKFARFFLFTMIATVFFAGCSTAKLKARKDSRDRLAASTKMYCDFVNNDKFPDVEVQLSMEMGKKCEADKPFSISSMRTVNDTLGIVYCCNLSPLAKLGEPAKSDQKADARADAKGDSKVEASPAAIR